MLEVVKFIKNNENNWKELLQNEPYFLNVKEDDNYVLLKYSQIASDFNEQICRECRGLILSKKDGYKPVRLAFYKFFNVQEVFADIIDWPNSKVRAKIDGSMMSVWHHNGKWHLSTSGAIDAYNTPVNGTKLSFGQVFEKALVNNGITWQQLCASLCIDYCYTFELVSPETRVVIPYEKADLYLIGVRDMSTLEELNIEDIPNNYGIKTPELYELNNFNACIEAANALSYDEEGYVAVDSQFKRVKIKSPAYVALHHTRMNGIPTEARMFDIIEAGEASEFLSYFSEFQELFDLVIDKKNMVFEDVEAVLTTYQNLKEFDLITLNKDSIDRKEYAIRINSDKVGKKYSAFIFKLLDEKVILNGIELKEFIQQQWNKLSRAKKLQLLGIKNNDN